MSDYDRKKTLDALRRAMAETAAPGHKPQPPPPAAPVPASQLPDAPEVFSEYGRVMRGARQQFDELTASAGLCTASDAAADEVLFVRIEGTGGKNAIVFLAGMLWFEADEPHLEQSLAREPAEEPAVLQAVADRLASARLAVTFDTRPGDLTVFRKRCEQTPVDLPDRLPQNLNLRADFRQRFGSQVRSFSIRALEQTFCARRRDDPLDRRACGDIYNHFLTTGDDGPLQRVLRANRDDLVTMVQLLTVLLTGCEPCID